MINKDFLLLVVAAGEGKPITPVQLQKSLFLIKEANLVETPDQFYEFEPYHYGPFDANVYSDADILKGDGMVERIPSANGSWTDTLITPDGLAKAKLIENNLSLSTKGYIYTVVQWVQSLSFSTLLRAIYGKYPQYRENSVFQG